MELSTPNHASGCGSKASYSIGHGVNNKRKLSSFDISTMRFIPEELAVRHGVALMKVERRDFLKVVCLLSFIFNSFYR